jgi:hypothetical protein
MNRIYPKQLQDILALSRLLEAYLAALEQSPMQVSVSALSFDTRIPLSIFRQLRDLHKYPDGASGIHAADFHILFANIMFRYPTVRIWQQQNGSIFFEM